ncbi:MAG: hypothetical protein FWD93_00600 [Coriobacteriia bacterium]|nr:hypothetical protein [Coriobacteriia bacterium]
MPTVSLAMNQKLIDEGRKRASEKGITFNDHIRKLIEADIEKQQVDLNALWAAGDKIGLNTGGRKITGEDKQRDFR